MRHKNSAELAPGPGLPGVEVCKPAVVRSKAQALAILLCEGDAQEVLAPGPEQCNVSLEAAWCQMWDHAVKGPQ